MVSKVSHEDNNSGDFEKAAVERDQALMPDRQPAPVPQPCEEALHLPALPVALQLRPSWSGGLFLPRRCGQISSPPIPSISLLSQSASKALSAMSLRGSRPVFACMSARVGMTSFTSAGDAEARAPPTGRPCLSATTIHFVPFPFLVFPTQSPLFWPGRSCRP